MQRLTEDVDFLFIYEVKQREIDSICLLGAWLENKGYKVGYINSWDSMYHRHTEYSTKVAVISSCCTSGAYSYFTGHSRHFEKAINLQWEQVRMNFSLNSKVQIAADFRGQALETRHVCWGENNRQFLHERYGVPLEMLRVCGYLPLDFYREELRDATEKRETLFARYGLDPSKQTLLFISSFADAGKPESEIELQEGDPQENLDKRNVQATNQKIILDWFRKLCKEDVNVQIIYRPHPAEASNPNILQIAREIPNFHVIGQESIRNWIVNCDILCNWQSTAMIEMYAAKKKTLILRPQPIPYLFSMPIFEEGHFKAVTTYDELIAGIREENPEFPVDTDILLQFYSITDRPVYERLGQYLIDTMNDPDYQCPDIGNHMSPKGRIIHRVKMKSATARAKTAHGAYRLFRGKEPEKDTSARAAKIRENYLHYTYYEQKMRQNRSSPQELREKIDAYRKMIGR